MSTYRVPVFLFIDAESKADAEELATLLVHDRAGGGSIEPAPEAVDACRNYTYGGPTETNGVPRAGEGAEIDGPYPANLSWSEADEIIGALQDAYKVLTPGEVTEYVDPISEIEAIADEQNVSLSSS